MLPGVLSLRLKKASTTMISVFDAHFVDHSQLTDHVTSDVYRIGGPVAHNHL